MAEEYKKMKNESSCSCKKEVKQWKDKAEDYLNGWKRAKADYINYKKETEEKNKEMIQFANALFISELLPILDNFTKALSHAKHEAGDKHASWIEGFGHIVKQFDDLLGKRGITKIKSTGEEFNPEFHDAAERTKKEGVKAGTIIREIEAGYMLKSKVLRPAKVVVAE